MPIAHYALAALSMVCLLGCQPSDTSLSADAAPAPIVAKAKAAPKPKHKPAPPGRLTGQDAMGDWTSDGPGVIRKITVADLPEPYATGSSSNPPQLISRPEGAWPIAPPGFQVQMYTTGLHNPREIVTAPNGDFFVADSSANQILLFRGATSDGKAEQQGVFAKGLNSPFGIAFYPPGPNPEWVYVGNTDSVVRFPYHNGDLQATGPSKMIVPNIPGGGRLQGGGHWTRDVRFSLDGNKMFVSVGSATNDDDKNDAAKEKRRADILEFDPEGQNERIYASGIRNAVGLAIQPKIGALWCSVNERDALGDNLVPDYITRPKDGGFYGWPWFYMGSNWDPRHKGEHPDLKDKVLVPEVLLQSHSASLCITFYTGSSFPADYRHEPFAAEHGSWNRSARTGYKVIRLPLKSGAPTGEYEDFLTGFATQDGVWGRPVGITVAHDGALMVTDDGSNSIWRVQYVGGGKKH